MLSLRTLTRSAPRAARSLRQTARPSTFIKPSTVYVAARPAASFSTTSPISRSKAAESEVNEEFLAKLDSEIQFEQEMNAEQPQPSSVTDFLANSPFELIDVPGQELVQLVRKFGDEVITVSFSVNDLNSFDPYEGMEGEEDLEDDLDNTHSSSSDAQQKGSRSVQSEEDIEDEEDMDDVSASPIMVSIVIEKPSKANTGALHIDTTARHGVLSIDAVSYFNDAKIAHAKAPEDAQKRTEVYAGPPFGSLDEDLQVLMERFLEERGISQNLAVFVPDYVDMKEQKEYIQWLNNIKGFVQA